MKIKGPNNPMPLNIPTVNLACLLSVLFIHCFVSNTGNNKVTQTNLNFVTSNLLL